MELTTLDIILMAVIFLLALYILLRAFLPWGDKKKVNACGCCTREDCPVKKIHSKKR